MYNLKERIKNKKKNLIFGKFMLENMYKRGKC